MSETPGRSTSKSSKSGQKPPELVITDVQLQALQTQFRTLCKNCKVQQSVADTAFRLYLEIHSKYVLTGQPLHWLACALYFTTPHDSKGSHNNPVPSYMSLAIFLTVFDLSFDDFIKKCEKWTSMSPTNAERMMVVLRDHHQEFTVSKLMFRSFDEMFWLCFSGSRSDAAETALASKLQEARTAHAKKKPPNFNTKKAATCEEVFQFAWALFCYVRREEGKVKDIVSSTTLLITCMEYMIQNVAFSGLTHLLNPAFGDFPPEVFAPNAKEYQGEIPLLMECLCARFDGMLNDARGIKVNWLLPRIKTLQEKETLKLDPQFLVGCLKTDSIAWNIHGIFSMYYESNEKVRGYDELQLLRLPRKMGDAKVQFDVKKRPVELKGSKKGAKPAEIITMKVETANDPSSSSAKPAHLAAEEKESIVSNLTMLQKLLHECSRTPSSNLLEIFNECRATAAAAGAAGCEEMSLETRVEQLVRACVTKFRENHGDVNNVGTQEDLAVTLYYKMLEGIVVDEKSRLSPAQIGVLLAQDVLHHALVAASFEVVIFCTKDTAHQFPWILNTLSLMPFNFFKVIELMIRIEPEFSRDVVTHLSRTEEQILESMAWTDESPLWDRLFPGGKSGPIPSCHEAFLPGQLKEMERTMVANASEVETTNLVHHSPVPSSTAFRDAESRTEPVAMGEIVDQAMEEINKMPEMIPKPVTRNQTSIGIFFRKFYHLAFVRLNCFSELLEMKRSDLVQRAWTCFEHALRNFTQIMRGRHLDQILMCCIYVMCKATGVELKFEDIMKCYRTQRNAASHIYRSVLIRAVYDNEHVPDTPIDDPSNITTEDRGDIIRFYNSVFLDKLGSFAEQFCIASSDENCLPCLSPVPVISAGAVSPRKRISKRCRVYVSPLNPFLKPPTLSPTRVQFQLSLNQRLPPKNVQAINSFVAQTRAQQTSDEFKLPAQKRLLDLSVEEGEEVASVVTSGGGNSIFTKKLKKLS